MEHPGRKKDEDEDYYSDEYIPFQGLDKGLVLQEKILFNETPLNPKKCCHLLTKLLYLITQGEKFTTSEATDVFFAVTKLFQSNEIVLRRMVYLVLKELSPMAEDVIIVSHSLMKDMNSNIDIYRANSIRVLCKILQDISILGQGERYLKQAVVDREPYVASAALVSGIHLLKVPSNVDLVKRWISEVQEASKSKYTMVQYHALGLLYQLKQHDRLAVSKLVTSMTKTGIRSPYAHCMLIRYAASVIRQEGEQGASTKALYDYLESCLRHQSDMVEFEAARAICSLGGEAEVSARKLAPAVAVLSLFLSSPKATQRFAAVRTLNKVAITHRGAVSTCNLEMENLITDSNRSIATLAITTLLKTGTESSIDRLMKQISNFMSEITDEFKIVVVQAIRQLCVKFPNKHRSLMNFLSTILRDEGGFEYKKEIVETILTIIREIPASKEAGLTHLCEFIEDCEYAMLSTKVLHVLGEEGPGTALPQKFIRYIYNRITLENATVRASAVNALAKFAVRLPELRNTISILLRRCLTDSDDEVRDRATFALNLLQQMDNDASLAREYILDEFAVPLVNLEKALKDYRDNPSSKPFDVRSVPTVVEEPIVKKSKEKEAKKEEEISFSSVLSKIPELASCGKVFTSSQPAELTESETEYYVTCIKHVFPEHVVFQFKCSNTLDDQLLENVTVNMEAEGEEFEYQSSVACAKILPNSTGSTYVVYQFDPSEYPTGAFNCTLKFKVKDVDTTTGDVEEEGYDDEYQLEDVEFSVSDYVQPSFCLNFTREWETIGQDNEVVEMFELSTMKTIKEAVTGIIEYLGMRPCEKSELVQEGATKHILYLSGTFLGDIPILARARMRSGPQGVKLELTVRSNSMEIAEIMATAL